jgi:glucose/arabinose dehydrogenase
MKNSKLPSFLLGAAAAILCGCYAIRPSDGGGQTRFSPPREINPGAVALPAGYNIEVVASGLTFPTGAAFDDQNRLHIVESGYCYGEVWTTPRLLRIEPDGTFVTVATGGRNGPWTGVAFHDGDFFVAEGGVLEGGKILRIGPDGQIVTLVDGLPSHGDHHTDGPAVSPDGWIYFGQGTASNSGVIGEDNAQFGWLKRRPQFHDIPGQDVILAGANFETRDIVDASSRRKVSTGAFVPFGTATQRHQVIPGQTKCNGAILRVRPDGRDLELVAWGFRNPFGLAFSPSGSLYVTDNGFDERGSRPIWGAPDVLWKVESGVWYGWPDYSGGDPVNSGQFKAPRKPRPKFLLAQHPNTPPRPVAQFGVHSSANGFDFSRNDTFGHIGEAFVALLGDESPATGKTLHPVGFKIVRVNLQTGALEEFAVNRGRKNGPASKIGGGGLERPVAARFDRDGSALYVVDFGVLLHDAKGAHPQKGTGVIWRIRRTAAP